MWQSSAYYLFRHAGPIVSYGDRGDGAGVPRENEWTDFRNGIGNILSSLDRVEEAYYSIIVVGDRVGGE